MTTRKVAVFNMADVSRARLGVWARVRGFDLSRTYGGREIDPAEFDFHTTVLATEVPCEMPLIDVECAPFQAVPVGFDRLGPNQETPVLRIMTQSVLASARDFLISTFGAVPTFNTFKPHVTLAYAWDGTPELTDLEPPDFPLIFDRFQIDDLA